MEELIARVAAAAGVSADQAQRAVNLVLAFLKREAPAEFAEVEHYLPGADIAISAGEADGQQGGGLMSSLLGALGGGSGLMGLASQLTGIGLSTGEMMTVGKQILDFARERAGDERVGQIAHAIPGLSQLL